MDEHMIHHAKQIALEQLTKTPAGEKLLQAVQQIQSIQAHLTTLSEKEDRLNITGIKAVTVLTLAILKKMASGQNPSSFSKEDWKEVTHAVSEYGIFLDEEAYSLFVFQLYESYIRVFTGLLEKHSSSERMNALTNLADELHHKEELFKCGEITEVSYIEDCLWISLESMIKLLASIPSLFCKRYPSEFAQILSSCAFEYGRLILYRKEQALIDQFIDSQYRLDAELEKKYTEYLSVLDAQSEQFYTLLDHAFDPDFRAAFLNSALLATAAGAKESDILQSVEDIDSFFLG